MAITLRTKQPGSNVVGAFNLGLSEAADLGNFSPNSGYHLPTYTLSLKDLKNLQGPNIDDVAREVSWQCVAVSTSASDETVVVGDVTPLSRAPRPAGQVLNGPLRMTSLSRSEIINRAYTCAKTLLAQQAYLASKYNFDGDYEPRMLRIPGLLVALVWLKSQAPNWPDWVLPLHTKIGDLKQEMYSMQDFLNIAKPLAEKRLASTIFD